MPLSSIVKFLNCLISPGSERDCRLYGGLPEAPAVLGIASTGYRPHSTLGRKQSGQATGPHKSSKSTRPCLKNVKTPKRRIFFRRFALIFLAIHRVWRRQIASTGKKSLVAAHFAIYQTRPRGCGEITSRRLWPHRCSTGNKRLLGDGTGQSPAPTRKPVE